MVFHDLHLPALDFAGIGRERLEHLAWEMELEEMGVREETRKTDFSKV